MASPRFLAPVLVVAVLLGGALLPVVVAEEAPPAKPPAVKVADLGWLEGSWATKPEDGRHWEAVYSSPSGGVVLSASKEVANGKVVTFDFERFFERNGTAILVPFPHGKAAGEFPIEACDAAARKATFTNPKNDFPRSLVYHRVADDRLEITLRGDQGGQQVEMVLAFARR